MSKSWFFNKFLGQSILGGNNVSIVMVMFCWIPIAVIFLHSFYIFVSYLRGALCHGLTFTNPLKKSETDLKRRPIFLGSLCFGDKKLTKLGQIQSCKFSLLLFN